MAKKVAHPEGSKTLTSTKMILVIQSGWVLVGDVRWLPDTYEYEVTDGFVIRVWGTDRGLGQLAFSGPRSETKLDPIPITWVPHDQLIFPMKVTFEGEWKEQ